MPVFSKNVVHTITRVTVGISLGIALLIAASLCSAQLSTTGTINGTVVDSSGAAVPGAKVAITNIGTQTVTRTVSNPDGRFSQVGLQSGSYSVRISAQGFASYRQTGFYLEPAGTYTVNPVLKPGSVSTTVTVSGNPVQVQTTTSEMSSTVSGEEAEALPLNGRNYQGLGSLMPGVVNTSPVGAMGTGGYLTNNSLSVNGAGTGGSLYTVDGVWNSTWGEHNQNTVVPNPDAISEVKVLQNNYSSQYTLMGNGVIMVQTKSGTTSFHGGGWEFLRNTFLDTRNYFVPASIGVSPEEWNIFGWNLGGPLSIPKLYNPATKKTFFYFNQQWVREKQQGVSRGASATSDMRQGIFPVPNSALSNLGSPYLAKANGGWLKDPTKTGSCNATVQTACFPNNQIPVGRIDQNALALMNALVPLPNNESGILTNYINNNPTKTNQMDVLAKLDIDLSSRFRLTAEYMNEGNTSASPSASRMGSPFSLNYDTFTSNDQTAQIQLMQMLTPSMTNQTSISMSNMVEDHELGGARFISQVSNWNQVLPYSGGFLQDYLPHVSFSGGWSPFGASSCCIIPRFTSLFNTVADNWSWLHGKHFLQAGITILSASTRQWNTGGPLMNGNFSFNGQTTGNPMGDYLLGYSNTFSQGNTAYRRYMHYPIVSPYVEDQWKASKRLTLNGGLRWFFLPWSNTQAGTAASFDPALYDPGKAPIVQTNGRITLTPNYDPANGMIINGKNGIPRNFTAAHQYYLAPVVGFALDVTGNGRAALRGGYGITYFKVTEDGCAQGCVNPPLLDSVNLVNVNFSDPAGASAPLTAPGTTGVDLHDYQAAQIQNFSLTWQEQFGQSWFASIGGAGSVTRHEPIGTAGPIFPLGQPAPVDGYDFDPRINSGGYSNAYFSPYPGYGSVGMYRSIFKGNWYALETSLHHPVGHGVYLRAAYTWSHNLDNLGGWVDPYKLESAYGNSTVNGNIPHLFTASVIYALPFFQASSGWKHELLGGWKYSDMTTIQSGSYSSVGMSVAHSGLATRPDQTGPMSYPKHWRDRGLWFDTSVFSQPAPGHYGNVGNGTLHDPGLVNFNMAAYKSFPIEERVKVQFRAEFFNVFNHTNPNGPNTSLGSSNFGTITSAKDARVGELAMKFNF